MDDKIIHVLGGSKTFPWLIEDINNQNIRHRMKRYTKVMSKKARQNGKYMRVKEPSSVTIGVTALRKKLEEESLIR